MFTPQQIQEQTFSKAVFGGYDMQQVDDFLEPLTEDYISLYKENSVLKAKMKILVEKLEEYRAQEASMKQAAADAQARADRMLADAQARCSAMLRSAEVSAQQSAIQQAVGAEQERLNYAKQTALNFIEVVEKDIRGHLDLLETLKSRDLTVEAAPGKPAEPEKPAHEKPYDWQLDMPAAPAPQQPESAHKIADEISVNLEQLIGADDTPVAPAAPAAPARPARPSHPESATIKFDDLKFGRNYDPNGSK